jgi:hypothetical protein
MVKPTTIVDTTVTDHPSTILTVTNFSNPANGYQLIQDSVNSATQTYQ